MVILVGIFAVISHGDSIFPAVEAERRFRILWATWECIMKRDEGSTMPRKKKKS